MDASARRSLATQAAVGLASFLTPFLYGALSVAVPTMGREFDFTTHQMALLLMAHLLFSTACNLPFGRLSDLVGRKSVFMAGSILFATSSLLAGLAHAPWVLVAARALQGVGDAMTFGVSAAILVSVVEPGRTGRALGINIMFVYAGLALGPLAGGALTTLFSWRVIFFLSSLAGLAALALIMKGYSQPEDRTHTDVDWRGMAFYLPGMLALIAGLSQAASWTGLGLLGASAVLFLVFGKVEPGREHPLLDLDYLVINRPFSLANATSVLGYAAGFSLSFLASLLLQSVMGMPAGDAGMLLLVQPAVMTVASPLAGRLSDRYDPAWVSATGLAVLGLSMFAFAGLAAGATPGCMAWLLGAAGFGFALFVSPNINAIMRCVDAPHAGMASGLLATTRGLGMCVSLSMTGMVLAWLAGGDARGAGPEVLPALTACFVLSGVVSLGGAWVSLKSSRPQGLAC